MTEQTKRIQSHKQKVTWSGKPIQTSSAAELFGLVEGLLRTMDETGTFELGFQGEFGGGCVELSASRHRFDVEWDEGDDSK